jgi:branched-chain amino acid transport system substrate-binding protein
MRCKKTQRCKKRIWALSKQQFGFTLMALCLGIAFLATACRTDTLNCDDSLGCAVIRPNSPVHLATLLPISGDSAVWGQELSRGINLAVMEQGEELLDHEIELVSLDSACDPSTGQQAIQTLNADVTLVGIIGPACSDVATAVLPTVRRNDWLMISPASSLPDLTEDQSELAFFRTVPNHLHQATVAAHFAYEQLGARQAAVFQDETAYNGLLAQQFSNTFAELGGIVSYQATLEAGQTELMGILDEASATPPDVIYLALFEPEANLLINRLAETSRLNQAALVGGDSLLTDTFTSRVGEAAIGMTISGPLFSGDAYDAFLAQWTTRYETPPTSSSAAYAYDAVRLLFAAVEEVVIVGPNGSLVIGRSALRQRLAETRSFAGLAGTLNCAASGECGAAAYGVYLLDTAVLNNTAWPPPLVWQFEE